jgi:hypothetical protein
LSTTWNEIFSAIKHKFQTKNYEFFIAYRFIFMINLWSLSSLHFTWKLCKKIDFNCHPHQLTYINDNSVIITSFSYQLHWKRWRSASRKKENNDNCNMHHHTNFILISSLFFLSTHSSCVSLSHRIVMAWKMKPFQELKIELFFFSFQEATTTYVSRWMKRHHIKKDSMLISYNEFEFNVNNFVSSHLSHSSIHNYAQMNDDIWDSFSDDHSDSSNSSKD